MPYIEFCGPPGCGKTTMALQMLRGEPELAPGRRSLCHIGATHHVTRLGLPPDGARMWLYLLSGLPRDMTLALRFFFETQSLRSARAMMPLLIKGRLLAASRHRWVVDQGLHQLVLDSMARGELRTGSAQRWKSLFASGPWAAEQLIEPKVDTEELVRRVGASRKHMAQCGPNSPQDYVMAYVRGARKLAEGSDIPSFAGSRSPKNTEQA